MAGDGRRFLDAGYCTPKPMINAKGKTILEWTTRSLPFIEHNRQIELFTHPYHITFAIRSSHDFNHGLTNKLKAIYGFETNIVTYDTLTRGNLDTAHLTVSGMNYDPDEPLLILDADNKFDGSNFLEYVEAIPVKDYSVLCYFDPIDNSSKWCFAQIGANDVVEKISEKKLIKDGKPMVGVFYYSSHRLFLEAAEKILEDEKYKVKNEFFMSQTFQYFLENNIPLVGFKTKKVEPLGTPEDLKKFLNIAIPMRICIDLDGTICYTRKPNEHYLEVKPKPHAVETIQKLKKNGHHIIINTARHMKTCNNNTGEIIAKQGKTLIEWLEKYQIPYDELWFGKPLADVYIDDKALKFDDNWKEIYYDHLKER
jgi:capsule biosynthesis phosphatase